MKLRDTFEDGGRGIDPSVHPDAMPVRLHSSRWTAACTKRGCGPDPLGPDPVGSVTAFSDLGLSEVEIARYFGVDPGRIRRILADAAP